jgi:hypothetical protein
MTLWRRAPRSVYQVYDEESYLAGEDAPAGMGEPVDSGGPVGVGLPAHEERERMTTLSHGPRAVPLLTFGLLGVVAAVAAIIVVVQLPHRPRAAPAPVVAHRDRTPSTWVSEPQQPKPALRSRLGSPTQAVTAAPAVSAPAASAETPHRFATPSSRGFGKSGGSAVYPSTPLTLPSAAIAGTASWPTSELALADELPAANRLPSASPSSLDDGSPSMSMSPPTGESQIDGEFGFER